MKELIGGLLIGGAFAFAGWGWPSMSRRWIHLLFRTLSIECFLLIPIVYFFGWITAHSQAVLPIVLVLLAVPIVFFWELLPIPIVQFFKGYGTITIRLVRKLSREDDFSVRSFRDMKRNPQYFIFPYIQDIDISPIKQGRNYLSIRFCCPSSLPYELKLIEPSVSLCINGDRTKKQPVFKDWQNPKEWQKPKGNRLPSLTISPESVNARLLPGFVAKQTRAALTQATDLHKSVEVCLDLAGKDGRQKEHNLSTRDWMTFYLHS